MKKYQKVAINIAFLTMILSAGIANSYYSAFNQDIDFDADLSSSNKESQRYSNERKEKILNTFENSDYQSYKKIIGQNNKINSIINESAFQSFVIARTAARNGQYNKALKITAELKNGLKDKLG